MNLTGLIGTKVDQTQGFLEDGRRVPMTAIKLASNVVSQIKKKDVDGYWAVQLGFSTTKRASKAIKGHATKAGIKENNTPRFFREIRVEEGFDLPLSQEIDPSEVFKAGDMVNVTGTSKGKGYAGVVKRHGFHGGPRTHGQSDRERAPGSIGQTTTPGRVYKGKRMAGRMGNAKATIKNLTVLEVENGIMYVSGLVPGVKGKLVVIKKVGENKKFSPLFSVKDPSDANAMEDKEVIEKAVVETPVVEEVKAEAIVEEKPEVKVEASEEAPVEEAKEEKK